MAAGGRARLVARPTGCASSGAWGAWPFRSHGEANHSCQGRKPSQHRLTTPRELPHHPINQPDPEKIKRGTSSKGFRIQVAGRFALEAKHAPAHRFNPETHSGQSVASIHIRVALMWMLCRMPSSG
eukprot:364089-Chlamydomonas_euryale.AAC.18